MRGAGRVRRRGQLTAPRDRMYRLGAGENDVSLAVVASSGGKQDCIVAGHEGPRSDIHRRADAGGGGLGLATMCWISAPARGVRPPCLRK
jgi:hypothetical protein